MKRFATTLVCVALLLNIGCLSQEEKQKKEQTEKAAKLAAEVKGNQEAARTELQNSIVLTVYEKDFVPSDAMNNRFEDYVTFSVAYENTSQKDIRAFQGKVVFNDLFGDTVKRILIKISDPIKAGAKATWNGVMEYNQFIDSDERLKNAELKDLKVVWEPEKIIFSDGTSIPKDIDNK